MLKKIRNLISIKNREISKINEIKSFIDNDLKSPKVNLGQIQARLNELKGGYTSLNEFEFQVFSQWGDDGIIQYLINQIDIPNKTFVEFGVENYKESNTRFLLINNNWSGLVIDGSQSNVDFIKKDIVSWAFDLHAECSFITRDNINPTIKSFLDKGYDSEIGILSVDIDGNDYWIWKEIDVVNPVIVIVEYNSVFGRERAITVPYKEDFYRVAMHKSHLYYGASLKAFCVLGEQKGYEFVGCNSNGNNAYFIRKDRMASLRGLSCEEGYVESKFREYLNDAGERVSGARRIEAIKGMPVYDVESQMNGVL
jgi:hypothetical protein